MLSLKQILRASHVNRWNIVATTRDQSVAEHSFNVCMIARSLCKHLDIDDGVIIKAALEHDLDEIVFGDIPSPMKAKMLLDGIDVNEYISNSMRELTPFQKDVLKISDLLDAMIFIRDHGIGSHGKEVENEIHDRLYGYLVTIECSPTCKSVMSKFVDDVLWEKL